MVKATIKVEGKTFYFLTFISRIKVYIDFKKEFMYYTGYDGFNKEIEDLVKIEINPKRKDETKYWITTYRFHFNTDKIDKKLYDSKIIHETWLLKDVHPIIFLEERCDQLYRVNKKLKSEIGKFNSSIIYVEEIDYTLLMKLCNSEFQNKKYYMRIY